MKIKIIQTTIDSIKIAESISELLVNNNASPCVQIISNVKSVYQWKDKVEHSSEILLLIKTLPEKIQKCKLEPTISPRSPLQSCRARRDLSIGV